MPSKATTVKQYLNELPAERRAALEAVRAVFHENLDRDYEEGMQYGMIGYYVPHSVYPSGYHCNPKEPLPFAGLASQKNHMSISIMGMYGDAAQTAWFTQAWAKTGKKLDMGKCCIRFKRVEDLALDVIAEALRRMPAKYYVARYEATLAQMGRKPAKPRQSAAAQKKTTATATKKSPAVKKKAATSAKKTAAKKKTAGRKVAKKTAARR